MRNMLQLMKGEVMQVMLFDGHIVTMINIQCSLGFVYASVPAATTSTFLLFI